MRFSFARLRDMAVCTWTWLTEPAPPVRQRCFYLGVTLAVIAAFVGFRVHLGTPVFPVDDAYITLHNAVSLRDGHDVNYPGTSPLVGATSAVHLLVVALFTLVLPPIEALYTVTWLGILGWTLALARLAFVHGASIARAALLVAVGVLVAKTPHQLLNGLETGLAMGALAWTLAEASDRAAKHPWRVPALCGLLPFLRPELVVASGLILGVHAVRSARKTGDFRAGLGAASRDLGVALAYAAPWLLWYLVATGRPWPTTVGAKRVFFAEGCLPAALRWTWIRTTVQMWTSTLEYFSRAGVLLTGTVLGWAGLGFFAVFVGTYYAQFPGALGHYEQRYVYVTLPFLLFGVASCMNRRGWLAAGATALLVVTLDQSVVATPERWAEHQATCRFTRTELAPLADWCRHHLPPDARVLVHDAGYIAYGTRLHLIDLVGLKTPSAVEFHQRFTVPTCGAGRGEAVHQIALRTHPDYLVVLRAWDGIYRITESLRARGWQLDPRYGRDRQYVVYKLTPPQ